MSNTQKMDVGIIGSGNIGGALARHLTSLGHQVSIANSRGPASLADLAAETGATAVTAEQAAQAQDMVIITVPEKAVPSCRSRFLLRRRPSLSTLGTTIRHATETSPRLRAV